MFAYANKNIWAINMALIKELIRPYRDSIVLEILSYLLILLLGIQLL